MWLALRGHVGIWDQKIAQKSISLGITFLLLHTFSSENSILGTVQVLIEAIEARFQQKNPNFPIIPHFCATGGIAGLGNSAVVHPSM